MAVAHVRAAAEHRRAEEVKAAEGRRAEGRRALSIDFRTCAIILGIFLVGHPLRELFNKCCAALDAASRKVVGPIQTFIVDQAAPIAGGLTAFWIVARDWSPLLGSERRRLPRPCLALENGAINHCASRACSF
ncbi:hypothetical protein CHLRE_11g477733v5 [Chlamydomonas reinhardtii]|uniref:Uncharacterized protein n=1 Tax=Chlamydomonas reinhardtii TaxID=3055 RepID=A0A2K3D8F6_CHLRE|nr:uncharacterized protein CHLRE_11g477733v5 [Chlamydomonas reinhardtii]PNW76821.1 hypothetical protein CHLRE_11g477733v5 [Chlamydomonas reinhardtii]